MKMGRPNGEMEIKGDDDDDSVVEMRLFHGLESGFGEGKMDNEATTEWSSLVAWNVKQK